MQDREPIKYTAYCYAKRNGNSTQESIAFAEFAVENWWEGHIDAMHDQWNVLTFPHIQGEA